MSIKCKNDRYVLNLSSNIFITSLLKYVKIRNMILFKILGYRNKINVFFIIYFLIIKSKY